MKLHLFKCSKKQTKIGISLDLDGNKLPLTECDGGQWQYWKQIELNSESIGIIGSMDSKVILKNIEENGYCINEVTINFTENKE
jgi:hypothetical protein